MPSAVSHLGPLYEPEGTLPDDPINYSVGYRPRERSGARHFGFLPFPAKKPWQVVQHYVRHYTSPGDTVLDPFAGSGVTPVESLVLGRRAIASDINPVARFITRMTAVAPVDIEALEAAFYRIQAAARTEIESLDSASVESILRLLEDLEYPRVPIPETVRRSAGATMDQLHTPRQLAALTILRNAIDDVEDDLQRDLMRVALANTVRYANRTYAGSGDPAKESQYRGNANFLRRFSFSPARNFYEHQVWPTFEKAVAAVVRAKAETNALIGDRYRADFVLKDVPAARIHEVTGENAIDYCFTDPPYSNEIYFLDLSTLWAAWLGLEITDEARREELVEGGKYRKSRQQFLSEFRAAVESIARSLKPDRWFTLVYKHRDLSLWQNIVTACEDNELHYINSVWQRVPIRSTRQIENPNINPEGDMYLNFRKMSHLRFESIYGRSEVVELPTESNYVAHEIERIIVAYLGADIELITSLLIQQVLYSRAFRKYQEDPEIVQHEIDRVLVDNPKFTTWKPASGNPIWVLAPDATVDPSLDPADRARYRAFELLRDRVEVTEGELAQHLLTYLAEGREAEEGRLDVRALLANLGEEVAPHRWRFSLDRVTGYKQLRLLFRPSQADELRERVEQLQANRERALKLDLEGLAVLRDRLRAANEGNREFPDQFTRLMNVLQTVVWRLRHEYGDRVEQVLAVGEWARYGIDLRDLPNFYQAGLSIVLNTDDLPFDLYEEVAEKVFVNLQDEEILVQFRLETLSQWKQAVVHLAADEDPYSLGIPLLRRI